MLRNFVRSVRAARTAIRALVRDRAGVSAIEFAIISPFLLAIGIGMHGLSFSEALRVYTLLTIGDGLVAQIPAMFLSLATAIIVTRVTTSQSMSEQAGSQLGRSQRQTSRRR